MLTIGLTGPTGAGKSAAAAAFAGRGAAVIDADAVAREVTAPGSPCLGELAARFGPGIKRADGRLERAALAALAFESSDGRAALNAITHKYILVRIRELLAAHRDAGAAAAVVDAPLLFESGFDSECDFTVAVTAPKEVRLRRVMARDGITHDAAELRMKAQHDCEWYASRAGFVIVNNGGLDEVGPQIEEICTKMGI